MKTNENFTVVYYFKIIKGKENDFTNVWEELTKRIYKYEGSYDQQQHEVNKYFILVIPSGPIRRLGSIRERNFTKPRSNYGDKCVTVVQK